MARAEISVKVLDLPEVKALIDDVNAAAASMRFVVDAALEYESAWNQYADPSTSPDLTEHERILVKARAHHLLLGAIREYRRMAEGSPS